MDKILQAFKRNFANGNYPKIYSKKKSLLESTIWNKRSEKKGLMMFFRHFFLKTKPIEFKF